MVLAVLKNANAALAFFLELGVLAALGYWGIGGSRLGREQLPGSDSASALQQWQ